MRGGGRRSIIGGAIKTPLGLRGIGEGVFPVVVIEADGVRYIALRMALEFDRVMMSHAGPALIEAE